METISAFACEISIDVQLIVTDVIFSSFYTQFLDLKRKIKENPFFSSMEILDHSSLFKRVIVFLAITSLL